MIRVSEVPERTSAPFLQSSFEIVYDPGNNPSLNGSYGPALLSGRAASAELLAKAICLIVDRSGIVQNIDDPIDRRYLSAARALSDSIEASPALDAHVMRLARGSLMTSQDAQGVLHRAQFALESLAAPAQRPLTVSLPPILLGLQRLLSGIGLGSHHQGLLDPSLTAAAQALSLASTCRSCHWFSPDTGVTLRAGIEIRTSGKGYRLCLPWPHALLRLSHQAAVRVLKSAFAGKATQSHIFEILRHLRKTASQVSPGENETAAIERSRDFVVLDYACDAFRSVQSPEDLFQDPVMTLAAATAAALGFGAEMAEGW